MLAKEQRIVARRLAVIRAVAIIIAFDVAIASDVVAVTVDVIINRLDATDVAKRGRGRVSEKGGWGVFHRVETETIAPCLRHHPHRSTDEIRIHVFTNWITVRPIERTPRTRNRREIRVHIVGVAARLTQKGNLVRCAAFRETEILIHGTALVREINQTRERTVLHLPFIAPIADVIPVAIRAVSLATQMEILHGQPRIKIRGRAAVVTGNVKAAMIHDVVEIHAQPEAVRRLDHVQ